jgi:hypothetical protein
MKANTVAASRFTVKEFSNRIMPTEIIGRRVRG